MTILLPITVRGSLVSSMQSYLQPRQLSELQAHARSFVRIASQAPLFLFPAQLDCDDGFYSWPFLSCVDAHLCERSWKECAYKRMGSENYSGQVHLKVVAAPWLRISIQHYTTSHHFEGAIF